MELGEMMNEITWVVLILEILVGGVLIPIGWRISSSLSKIFSSLKIFTESLNSLCTTMKEVTTELTEARLRDETLKNEINNIKESLTEHVKEERGK